MSKLILNDAGRSKFMPGEDYDCFVRTLALAHKLEYPVAHKVVRVTTGRRNGVAPNLGCGPYQTQGQNLMHHMQKFFTLDKLYGEIEGSGGWHKCPTLTEVMSTRIGGRILLGFGHILYADEKGHYDTDSNSNMRVHSVWYPYPKGILVM